MNEILKNIENQWNELPKLAKLVVAIILIGIGLGIIQLVKAGGCSGRCDQPDVYNTYETYNTYNYYLHECDGTAGAAAIGSHQYFITNSQEVSFAASTNGDCIGWSVGTYFRTSKDSFVTVQGAYEPEAERNGEMLTIQGTIKF